MYAGTSALLLVLAAVPISMMIEPPVRLGVLTGVAAAWLVQAAAFAILLLVTDRRPKAILAGWTVGTVLRFAVLGLVAWLTLGGSLTLPPEPTLIALAAALFALLLLEPVVYRYQVGTR